LLFAAACAQPNAVEPARAHADAGQAERRAVLAVSDQLFAALASKDRSALLAAVVPEGRATATFTTPGGERRVESESWTEFADRLALASVQLRERLIDPHVHVEGDIAMIWSRYEFEIDGRFSHCGIDHFDLVRIEGRWRILNLTWTKQQQGCPGR
jgi:ketosteroid isomerase-like protein